MNKKGNLFYLIIILTILVMRISLFLLPPNTHVRVLGIVIHHFWFGILLIGIGLIIPKKKEYIKIFAYAIGVGLIIDELIFMVLGAGTDRQYWALPSMLGMIIILLVIFPIREKIINFLMKK